MKKRIVLCADDYGQAPTISAAILDLVQKERLTAVSCMVNSPFWQEHAALLLPFRAKIDVGLHFNLTEGRPLSAAFRAKMGDTFPSLLHLMGKSWWRRLNQAVIQAELRAQLDAFVNAMGELPDFLDGHQHVHQFPIIRAALVAVYADYFKAKRPYVRLVATACQGECPLEWLKQVIIRATGTGAMRQLLVKHHIPHNTSFAGVYHFAKAAQYPRLFARFLRDIKEGGVIMCHPGYAGDEADVIGRARVLEYQYLSGPDFHRALSAANVVFSRKSRMPPE